MEIMVEYAENCPECESAKLSKDYERAEVVCTDCGLVIDENIIDCGPEWRTFDNDQHLSRSRTGAPMTLTIHDKGLSTMIDWRNKDIYGNELDAKKRAQVYRLRKWQQRIRIANSTERNLATALTQMERLCSKIGLPKSVRENAAMLYRRAVNKGLIRGRSIEDVTVATIYAACRQCKVPRTLDEISNFSHLNRKEIGRTYRFIIRELGVSIRPSSPTDYVERFGTKLGLSGETRSKAIEILKQAKDKDLTSGRGPTGVSAAALYIASLVMGEKKTQKEVSDVAGVTEVTIRNRYKELTQRLDINLSI